MAKLTKPPKLPRDTLKPGQTVEPDLSDLQYSLIGRVTANWSELEAQMDLLIWALTGLDDEDGRVITGRMDANSKIQKLRPPVPSIPPDRAAIARKLSGCAYPPRLAQRGTELYRPRHLEHPHARQCADGHIHSPDARGGYLLLRDFPRAAHEGHHQPHPVGSERNGWPSGSRRSMAKRTASTISARGDSQSS